MFFDRRALIELLAVETTVTAVQITSTRCCTGPTRGSHAGAASDRRRRPDRAVYSRDA
ncbi:hypothetical protein AB0L70_06970 [Kribbella sp. NPDC051952]|uniref:hypothetical protein n=1 Tax=Kribbella sp. NPDC051952 TaxID=3154851 RepID=UPI003413F015